jgi:hypothetical protein
VWTAPPEANAAGTKQPLDLLPSGHVRAFHTHTHTHACTHTHMHTCTRMGTHTHTRVHTHTYYRKFNILVLVYRKGKDIALFFFFPLF